MAFEKLRTIVITTIPKPRSARLAETNPDFPKTRLCRRNSAPRWSSSHRISVEGYLRAAGWGKVKLFICYWPNTGQRVANGTIRLQLRDRKL